MFYPHDEFCVHRMSTKHAVIWVLDENFPPLNVTPLFLKLLNSKSSEIWSKQGM